MPAGLLGAFKFCDGRWSLKHRLLRLVPEVGEEAGGRRAALTSAALEGDLPSGQQRIKGEEPDGKRAELTKVRRDTDQSGRGQAMGTGRLESCCWSRLMAACFY